MTYIESSPPTTSISSMLSTRQDSDDYVDSLGWDDIPVVVHNEVDPSTIIFSHPQQISPQILDICDMVAPGEASIQIVSPQHQYKSKKYQLDSEDLETFGWSDFPLLCADGSLPSAEMEKNDNDELETTIDGPVCPVTTLLSEDEKDSAMSEQKSNVDNVETTFGSANDTAFRPFVFGETKSRSTRSQQKHKTKRAVQFSLVNVRTYAIQLGDHPLCSYPLSLDWTYEDSPVAVAVDDYEEERANCSWRSKPHRTDVLERRLRLATVLDVTAAELETLERGAGAHTHPSFHPSKSMANRSFLHRVSSIRSLMNAQESRQFNRPGLRRSHSL